MEFSKVTLVFYDDVSTLDICELIEHVLDSQDYYLIITSINADLSMLSSNNLDLNSNANLDLNFDANLDLNFDAILRILMPI